MGIVIKSSDQISDIFRSGSRFNGRNLSIITKEYDETQRDQVGRVAFIAGKKLGCAVVRNRSKRVLRAVAREAGLPAVGRDVVLVATPRTRSADHAEVVGNLRELLRRARVR